jgi:hypothetical protein
VTVDGISHRVKTITPAQPDSRNRCKSGGNMPHLVYPEDAEQGDVVLLEGMVDGDDTDWRRTEVQDQIKRLKRRGGTE